MIRCLIGAAQPAKEEPALSFLQFFGAPFARLREC